jgi:hypothetical protein
LRASAIFAAGSGIIGAAVLGVYFSQPVALPAANASVDVVNQFALHNQRALMLGGWIQAVGTLFAVVFFVGLVVIGEAAGTLAGMMTIISSAAIWIVGLVEVAGLFTVSESAQNGHPAAASVAYDITNVFVHVIPIGPAGVVFLSLAALVLGSRALPAVFGYAALAIGLAFEAAGFFGLASRETAQAFVTPILIAQEIWLIAAAIVVLVQAITRRADWASAAQSAA